MTENKKEPERNPTTQVSAVAAYVLNMLSNLPPSANRLQGKTHFAFPITHKPQRTNTKYQKPRHSITNMVDSDRQSCEAL